MADQYNSQRFAFRQTRIAAGLCRDCGKCPPLPERVVCDVCMKARSARQRKYKDERNNNFLCRICGGDLELERLDKDHCLKCSQKQTERARQARRRNKELIFNYFGGKCLHCNIGDFRVLTLDHIDGDGHLDRQGKRVYATS